jgi:hypothetical protein
VLILVVLVSQNRFSRRNAKKRQNRLDAKAANLLKGSSATPAPSLQGHESLLLNGQQQHQSEHAPKADDDGSLLIHLQTAEMLANVPDDGGADDDPVFTLCGDAPPSDASVDPAWQAYSNSVQAAVTDRKLTHVHMHPSSRSAAFPGMAWCLPAFNPKGVSATEQPAVCTDACHSCAQQYFSRYFFYFLTLFSVLHLGRNLLVLTRAKSGRYGVMMGGSGIVLRVGAMPPVSKPR